jgi:hypothetical protein
MREEEFSFLKHSLLDFGPAWLASLKPLILPQPLLLLLLLYLSYLPLAGHSNLLTSLGISGQTRALQNLFVLAPLLPVSSQRMTVDSVTYSFSRDFTSEDPLIMGLQDLEKPLEKCQSGTKCMCTVYTGVLFIQNVLHDHHFIWMK